ncbi:MAG: hypothetical protein DYG92_02390 [Leptolyngbya sp. PLA1]|nr:hypothetical protein [Leptolyngbya sp. PLA1]
MRLIKKGFSMNMLTRVVMTVVAAATAVLATGCQQTVRGWKGDLVITPDASLRDSSGKMPPVEVDVVAINETDEMVRSYPVDNWFSGEDKQRASCAPYTKSLAFGPGAEGAVVISKSDPIWKKWEERGYKDLVVFATARSMKASPGGFDGRRKVIPLTNDKWDVGQINFEVKSSGVECPTPMKLQK